MTIAKCHCEERSNLACIFSGCGGGVSTINNTVSPTATPGIVSVPITLNNAEGSTLIQPFNLTYTSQDDRAGSKSRETILITTGSANINLEAGITYNIIIAPQAAGVYPTLNSTISVSMSDTDALKTIIGNFTIPTITELATMLWPADVVDGINRLLGNFGYANYRYLMIWTSELAPGGYIALAGVDFNNTSNTDKTDKAAYFPKAAGAPDQGWDKTTQAAVGVCVIENTAYSAPGAITPVPNLSGATFSPNPLDAIFPSTAGTIEICKLIKTN